MAFAEVARWRASSGEVAAMVAGPPQPDLARWTDGQLPEISERQQQFISAFAAVLVAAAVFWTLAQGVLDQPEATMSDAIEVLRLEDPVIEREAGPAIADRRAPGESAPQDDSPRPQPIQDSIVQPPTSPLPVLNWSRQRIARASAADTPEGAAANGVAGAGTGGSGIYDPYAGASSSSREEGTADDLAREVEMRLAALAAPRLGAWSGRLRCRIVLDSTGNVAVAQCEHRQGLAIPQGLGSRLIGLQPTNAASAGMQWDLNL